MGLELFVIGGVLLVMTVFTGFFFVLVYRFGRERQQFIRNLEAAQRQGLDVVHFLAGSGLLKPEYEAQHAARCRVCR